MSAYNYSEDFSVMVKNVNIPEITKNLLYQKLMRSLKDCDNSGLSLALYHDKIAVKLIINYLKRDLPDHKVFALQMNSDAIDFPALLKKIYHQTDKSGSIFHVIGIETLSEELISDFIACYKYAMKHLKSASSFIILWIPPQLEKELYFSKPNFYSCITGSYDFSDISINYSPPVKKCLSVQESSPPVKKQNKPSVLHKNISIYLEKVLWQYENREKVKEINEPFLIREMERINLKSEYTPLYCTDTDGKETEADDVFKEFLADKTLNILMLIGDPGMGKTAFTLYNFIRMAKQYMQNNENNRIPLFFSLKDYHKQLDIKDFILREFREKYKIGLSFDIFQRLALYGKFMIFVDGVDAIISADNSAENFKAILRLAFENEASHKPNKVLLTCEPEHFFTEIQDQKKNCKIIRIISESSENKEIEKDPSEQILETLNAVYAAEKLSQPPILAEMILKTMPILKDKEDVNLFDLYKAYTDIWINAEHQPPEGGTTKLFTPQRKREFLRQLAYKMLKRKETVLHYTKIGGSDSDSYPEAAGESAQSDYYKEESASCSFFKRDENGNYSFTDPSFMAYFLAEYYFDLIKHHQERLLSYNDFEREAKYFLKLMISSEKNQLQNLNLSSLDLEKINLTGADLTGANLQKARLNESNFTGANLTEVDLTKANLRRTNFTSALLIRAKLILADFFEADMTGADFTQADLQRVILSEANLTGANLQKANLDDADLTKANFQRTNLNEASLRWTNLQKVNFSQANLTDANMLKATLNEADFSEATLESANLNEADLGRASLNKANLRWAKMNKVNFSEANLSEANLSEANLWKANLQNADLSGANLQKAIMIKADLRWTNLNKTDLRGADLWQANLNKANLADAVYEIDDLRKASL